MKQANSVKSDNEVERFVRSLERAGLKPKIVPTTPLPVSFLNHDTSPGAGGIFSPPELWKGSKDDYLAFMRERYTTVHHRRLLTQCVRGKLFGGRVEFRGPWADEAHSILDRLVSRIIVQTTMEEGG